MKCRECGYNDRNAPIETPKLIAKRIVKYWFVDSSFDSMSLKDEKLLVKLIEAAIKEERNI